MSVPELSESSPHSSQVSNFQKISNVVKFLMTICYTYTRFGILKLLKLLILLRQLYFTLKFVNTI